MKKGRKSYNHNFIQELIRYTESTVKEKNYHLAIIMQASFIDYVLRVAISKNLPDDEKHKRYFKPNLTFATLINYFNLLIGDSKLFSLLDNYKNKRNVLVHEILEQEDIGSLNKLANKTYLLGEEIIESIKKLECFLDVSGEKGENCMLIKGKRGRKKTPVYIPPYFSR